MRPVRRMAAAALTALALAGCSGGDDEVYIPTETPPLEPLKVEGDRGGGERQREARPIGRSFGA